MLWTAYLNGGQSARGAEFARAVREIAARVGIDVESAPVRQRRDRRGDLLEHFFELCLEEIMSAEGASARTNLGERGLAGGRASGLGMVPAAVRTRAALSELGYTSGEIDRSGVVADSRWSGRICGAWRDESGRVRTMWARAVYGDGADARYLYLRGAPRGGLPPYGLSDVLDGPAHLRRDLVLVEGVLDVHQLRKRQFDAVAGVGGVGLAPQTFEALARLGCDRVTLCFDADGPGRAGAARAVEQATRARVSPALFVVDSSALAPAKDPDELVRERGADAFLAVLETRECAVVWRAKEFTRDIGPDAETDIRRDVLARAGAWLGALPARLALEQEDAVRVVAVRCGYSPAAVERAFRARFWREMSRGVQEGMRANGMARGL